jgi:hypothetical protein
MAPWLWLCAGLGAAVIRAVDPYEHGIWLVAYLLLVGALAQALLWRGRRELTRPAPERPAVADAALWNLGVIAVPAGVISDVRLPIAAGSVALLCSLLLLWRSVQPSYRSGHAWRSAAGREYASLLAFMLVSVITGMLLASDVPWLG